MSEKEILSALLTDETETLSTLVARSQRIIKINKATGDTVLLPPRTKLTDRQLIATLLLGRYFSAKLELTKSDSLSLEILRRLTNLEEGSITARLSELKKEGLVEPVSRGSYRVNYQSLASYLSLLEEIDQSLSTGPVAGGIQVRNPEVASSENPTDNVDFSSITDPDTVVLALYSKRALAGSQIVCGVDEIVEWASLKGRPLRRETLSKYTLPQDKTLKPWIVSVRNGKRTSYQLSKLGLEHAKGMLSKQTDS